MRYSQSTDYGAESRKRETGQAQARQCPFCDCNCCLLKFLTLTIERFYDTNLVREAGWLRGQWCGSKAVIRTLQVLSHALYFLSKRKNTNFATDEGIEPCILRFPLLPTPKLLLGCRSVIFSSWKTRSRRFAFSWTKLKTRTTRCDVSLCSCAIDYVVPSCWFKRNWSCFLSSYLG